MSSTLGFTNSSSGYQYERRRIQQKSKRRVAPKKEITTDPYLNYAKDQKYETIFVNLPSYRDPECVKTLADIFEKAKYPGRIFVGVCQQNDPDDKDCMESSTALRFKENIRILRLESDKAKGPVYARALIEQQLFHDEDYYLCIDSHTLFIPGWDVECVRQLLMCPSENPILTFYPPEYDIQTRQVPKVTKPGRFFKFRGFHHRLGFSEQDPVEFQSIPKKPQPTLFWGAGFSFTTGEVPKKVPFDPNLEYVFLGEEISMAARFWTHGYDFFAPMTAMCFHYTPRTYRPTFWEQIYRKNGFCKVDEQTRQHRKSLEAAGNLRIVKLLNGTLHDEKYGLGTFRTLEQFQDFIGLNFRLQTYQRHAKMGLSLNASPEEIKVKWGL